MPSSGLGRPASRARSASMSDTSRLGSTTTTPVAGSGRYELTHRPLCARWDASRWGSPGPGERVSRLEFVLGEVLRRHGGVLFVAARIGEPEVDELDLLVFNELQDVIGRRRRHCGISSLSWG